MRPSAASLATKKMGAAPAEAGAAPDVRSGATHERLLLGDAEDV